WAAKAPENTVARAYEARLLIVEGRWRAGQGCDPVDAYAEAERILEADLPEDSRNPGRYIFLAEVERWRAEWKEKRGQRADRELAHGLARVDKALTLSPDDA